MITRRSLLRYAAKAGFAGATTPLWSHLVSARAFAQVSNTYKAIVLVSMPGGNDGNNLLIPIDSTEYNQYAALRGQVAMAQGSCPALAFPTNGKHYGLHPALQNVASLYNRKKAVVVANVGPLPRPATKAQVLSTSSEFVPAALLSHPTGLAQWESASTGAAPDTGWGGRLGDLLASQSGLLPPVLDAGPASIFTVGHSVQAISVQSNNGLIVAIPPALDSTILSIAQSDAASTNQIVSQAAQLRIAATQQQVLLSRARDAGSTLQTQFPASGFGNVLKTIAQIMNGRSVIGASRQIFYSTQGSYDTHQSQVAAQASCLADLDAGLGAFMLAMDELGLSNQVLVCTHSDFGRTMQSNVTGGTDHAWGNYQLILSGGINGGRIIGTVPELELGGSTDMGGQGIWIPTTAATQMTAGIGSWMGLSSSQVSTVFPELANFPAGAISLT